MSIPTTTDDGGEDKYREDRDAAPDDYPGGNEHLRDEMREGHNEVLDELAPQLPPEAAEDVQNIHGQLLDDLAGAQSEPGPASPVQQIADVPLSESIASQPQAEPKKRGRYQVPLSQRTPATRNARRDAADKFRKAAQELTLQGFLEQGGNPQDAPEGEVAPAALAGALQGTLAANLALATRFAELLSEHEQKLAMILRRLEQGRL